MGRGQPYLYDAPRSQIFAHAHDAYDDGFNPKAVTMASRQPAPRPKPKPEGPLINFNKHPDSYLILPTRNSTTRPMSPKVKTVVKWARWAQLLSRITELLGALGMLVCVICIRGTQNAEGWIIRVPPAIDIATTLYAIYHLLRTSKARTPASSASYHFFALMIDGGLIPFYAFTALLANRNFNEQAGTSGRWRTFFPTDSDTNKILETAFLDGAVTGGLHCLSLLLDLYLVVVFRKISRLPPDMNPLEDNLTSRRKTKHKHKSSSISAITPLTEKRFSDQSGSTASLNNPNRNSQVHPLLANVPSPDVNKLSFFHTRAGSDISYSPHNPETARHSRTNLAQSVYSQPPSARTSRADRHRRDDSDSETLNQRKSMLASQAIQRSRPNSMVAPQTYSFVSSDDARLMGTDPKSSGHTPQKPSQDNLQSDNWFIHATADDLSTERPKSQGRSVQRTKAYNNGYNSVSGDMSDEEDVSMVPEPLRMNPPTPPTATAASYRPTTASTADTGSSSRYTADDSSYASSKPTLKRTTTTTSISSEATFTRSPTCASVKSRYYGDLKAATQGIRNSPNSINSPRNSPANSPTKIYGAQNNFPSAAKAYTTNNNSASATNLKPTSFASIRRSGEVGYTPVQAVSPRVVSRTGIDLEGDYFDEANGGDLGMGSGRRRDVSGKVAEEGRGGPSKARGWGMGMGGGLSYRKVSTGVA